MQDHIDRILIDKSAIAHRIKALADEITRDLLAKLHEKDSSGPAEITLIPILTGSFIFAADLIRHLPVMVQIRLLSISSYPGTATSSRGTTLRSELTNLPQSLEGSHVLLVDDILDSGRTLKMAVGLLEERNPASIHTCVLLHKQLRSPKPDAIDFRADYVAFDIPDEFVVGYGLDFNDYYRNLPDIATLKPHVVEDALNQTPDSA